MTCKLSARAVTRIKKAWIAGASLSELGAEHDVSDRAIHYHVKGLEREATPRMGRPASFDHARAAKLLAEGFSTREVAQRFGVSHVHIWRIGASLRQTARAVGGVE